MKYKKGFIVGVIMGLFFTLSVSAIYSYTDCFSCGFLGIDYCRDFGSICSMAESYMTFAMLISLPFFIFGLFISQFSWLNVGLPKFFLFISPLYLFYCGFLGLFIQKTFSKSHKQLKNQ